MTQYFWSAQTYRIRRTSLALAAAAATITASAASAQDARGTWLRDNGASKIRISTCGDALCGTIAWEKSPRTDVNNPDESKRSRPLVGAQVFFNMKSAGEGRWNGTAYNPEDGKTYSGAMVLSGDTLTTKGCVLGGLVCKSVEWSRSN